MQEDIEFSSFGELLKAFRKRRSLTQEQLGIRLGLHRNSVGRWERGEFLPNSRAIIQEISKVLKLDGLEARRLLEACLTTYFPYWNVPFPRNLMFSGREEILHELHLLLGSQQNVSCQKPCALYGLGGIGKTQVALEYAYRYALEYAAIFWIEAETVQTIIASFQRIAEILGLPEQRESDQQQIVTAVQRWLNTHKEWLLIWDNLEQIELLHRFLPPAQQGAILITTQKPSLGILVHCLELSPMKKEEGVLLLLRRAKAPNLGTNNEDVNQLKLCSPTEYKVVEILVKAMHGLPLALDQAGAYIEETRCSVADYVQHYEQQRLTCLGWRGTSDGSHPHSVVATVMLAKQRIEAISPEAVELLQVCAFLYPDSIAIDMFTKGTPELGLTLQAIGADRFQLDLAIAALRHFSLVQRHLEKQILTMHRLVQVVIRETMSAEEQVQWQQRVIRHLNMLFPEIITEDPEIWEKCEKLLPHVLTCVMIILDTGEDLVLANLLHKTATYLRERGQYNQVQPLYQRALRIYEQGLEPQHFQIIHLLRDMATFYRLQGKYEQAEPLYQEVLSSWEQTLGPQHPDLPMPLNGLAATYYEQGKYEQAEPLYRRSLQIWEQALGPVNPDLAIPLNGLAVIYYEQGKYEQAEALYRRALHIYEQTLGPMHPNKARPLTGLAALYWEQGKYEQAELLYQRALQIWEQAVGSEYSDPITGLAALYKQRGKHEQAELLYLRILRIREPALGSEHSQLAYVLNYRATLYRLQGKYEQAEALYQRSLQIWEQALGPVNPDLIMPLNGLAVIYYEQGRYEQAEALYRRALHIYEQTLGPMHPNKARPLTGLAALYREQGKYEQAELFYKQAIAISEQRLGLNHRNIAESLLGLAQLYERQGNKEQAKMLLQRAYIAFEQCLGLTHPTTVMARNDSHRLSESL
jgi:tetratricopeptide (TPR) repeat protein